MNNENNRLIAEFMQPSFNGFGTYDFDGCLFTHQELKFNKSWDWLMPVVNKITIQIEFTDHYPDNSMFWDAYCTICIDDVYEAVVEFIRYNQREA